MALDSSTTTDTNGLPATSYAAAAKWAADLVQAKPYIDYIAIKRRASVKTGESPYEYAFYEPSGRTDPYVARAIVDTQTYAASMVSTDRPDSMLKLFPTTPERETSFREKYATYVKQCATDNPDHQDVGGQNAALAHAVTELMRHDGWHTIVDHGHSSHTSTSVAVAPPNPYAYTASATDAQHHVLTRKNPGYKNVNASASQ